MGTVAEHDDSTEGRGSAVKPVCAEVSLESGQWETRHSEGQAGKVR